MLPVALTIAGSDPSGGAGLQADLKTFHQFGVYGAAAVTLLTVQNTLTVSRVQMLTPEFVLDQIETVLGDMPVRAAKTGALGSEDVVAAIAEMARRMPFPLVVDPVMISKHGSPLLTVKAQTELRDRLVPRAFLLTPNIPEAEALSGLTIESEDSMLQAARLIQSLGCPNVLIKGGHHNDAPNDLLLQKGEVTWFPGRRIDTPHTHGTGCTYSAAITAGLACNLPLTAAVHNAKRYIQAAIQTAPGLGSGRGPINHFAAATRCEEQPA